MSSSHPFFPFMRNPIVPPGTSTETMSLPMSLSCAVSRAIPEARAGEIVILRIDLVWAILAIGIVVAVMAWLANRPRAVTASFHTHKLRIRVMR